MGVISTNSYNWGKPPCWIRVIESSNLAMSNVWPWPGIIPPAERRLGKKSPRRMLWKRWENPWKIHGKSMGNLWTEWRFMVRNWLVGTGCHFLCSHIFGIKQPLHNIMKNHHKTLSWETIHRKLSSNSPADFWLTPPGCFSFPSLRHESWRRENLGGWWGHRPQGC